MASVGRAYAVMRGRLTGDQEEATKFLNSLSDPERRVRNNKESRVRNKLRTTRRPLGSRGR